MMNLSKPEELTFGNILDELFEIIFRVVQILLKQIRNKYSLVKKVM